MAPRTTRYTSAPNLPAPGEFDLAARMHSDPYAGMNLLAAQIERRAAIGAYNDTQQQMNAQQTAIQKQASQTDMLKALMQYGLSSPYTAPMVAGEMGVDPDDVARVQAQEAEKNKAETISKVGAGTESLSNAGVVPQHDFLTSLGVPSQFDIGTRPDIQKEQMGNNAQLEAARIGAGATVQAARERGVSGGKPKVTMGANIGNYGPVQVQGGEVGPTVDMYNQLMSALGQPGTGGAPLEQAEIRHYLPQLQKAASDKGYSITAGAVPKRTVVSGVKYVTLPARDQSGNPTEVSMIEP